MMTRKEALLYRRIGYEVRERRVGAGLSQEKLSKKAGLTRTSIVNMEAGRQRVQIDALIRMSAAIGCRASEIIGAAE